MTRLAARHHRAGRTPRRQETTGRLLDDAGLLLWQEGQFSRLLRRQKPGPAPPAAALGLEFTLRRRGRPSKQKAWSAPGG